MTERDKWLMQAVRDLETARNSLNSGDYYASAFWAQQAVEKALKALLLSWVVSVFIIYGYSYSLVFKSQKIYKPDPNIFTGYPGFPRSVVAGNPR